MISSNINGFVDTDIALEDDEGCYLQSGLDWEEVDAWMPMLPPYRADEENSEAYEAYNNAQAKKAMEQLKAYCARLDWNAGKCKRPDNGEKCIFDLGNYCLLNEYSPEDWELPQESKNEK